MPTHSKEFLWILRFDKFDPHRPYQTNDEKGKERLEEARRKGTNS
jgi:hypothetical protein